MSSALVLGRPSVVAAQTATAPTTPTVTTQRPAVAMGMARTKGLGCDRGTEIWSEMARPQAQIDDAHPKYFTQIIEVTGSGTSRVPFSYLDDPQSNRRGTCETVNADVDADSRVVIRFDREWLQKYNRNAVVSVRGELQSGTSSPQIEISGYSEIGKDRPGFATVRGMSDVSGTLSSLQLAWDDVRASLDAARDSADKIDRKASAALSTAIALRESTQRELDAAQRRLDSLTALTQQQQLTDSSQRMAAAQQIRQLKEKFDTANVQLRLIRQEPAYQASVSPTFVNLARRIIARRRTQLTLPLTVLAGANGQFARSTLARQRSLDPEAVRQVAEQARSVIATIVDAKAPESAIAPADRQALEAIQENVESFRSLMELLQKMIPASMPVDAAIVTQELRDAEVLLTEIGAKAGDVLVLHISDSIPDVVGRRQLDIRLRVRELGLVRRVSDAVLLLRRTQVGADYQDPRIVAGRAQFRSTGRADPVEESPLPANYLPAAGGSLLWTYYKRSGGAWYAKSINWLTPGFGINVSFASFPSRTVAFSKPDSAGAPPRETVTLSADKLQVAAGPVLTLFDNALQFTYGWNLNVSQSRQYFGVGFSFVNIAKRLGVTLGGTDNGK